jgi:hypothetical protein
MLNRDSWFLDLKPTEEGNILHPYYMKTVCNLTKPPEQLKRLRFIHPRFKSYIAYSFDKVVKQLMNQNLSKPREYFPSSGFFTLALFLSRCDFIDLYGFNTFPQLPVLDAKGVPLKYGHYWNLQTKGWSGHDFSLEAFVLHALSVVYKEIITIRN